MKSTLAKVKLQIENDEGVQEGGAKAQELQTKKVLVSLEMIKKQRIASLPKNRTRAHLSQAPQTNEQKASLN